MTKVKIILIVIVLLLAASSLFLGYSYFSVQKQLQQVQMRVENQQFNNKVLNFAKIFIGKVLKAKTEVDFETRLQLENAVRDLSDQEILTQWQAFVDSQTEAEAQDKVKDLLEMLVNKIKV